ncbi:MAG: hypothetical protein M3O22_07650 [Pseudomonadota bacterium]|nr:hypothetical protein [Pseudomonadota bacterium]
MAPLALALLAACSAGRNLQPDGTVGPENEHCPTPNNGIRGNLGTGFLIDSVQVIGSAIYNGGANLQTCPVIVENFDPKTFIVVVDTRGHAGLFTRAKPLKMHLALLDNKFSMENDQGKTTLTQEQVDFIRTLQQFFLRKYADRLPEHLKILYPGLHVVKEVMADRDPGKSDIFASNKGVTLQETAWKTWTVPLGDGKKSIPGVRGAVQVIHPLDPRTGMGRKTEYHLLVSPKDPKDVGLVPPVQVLTNEDLGPAGQKFVKEKWGMDPHALPPFTLAPATLDPAEVRAVKEMMRYLPPGLPADQMKTLREELGATVAGQSQAGTLDAFMKGFREKMQESGVSPAPEGDGQTRQRLSGKNRGPQAPDPGREARKRAKEDNAKRTKKAEAKGLGTISL